jgi:hypothetical protein
MQGTIVDRPEQVTGLWESDVGSAGVVGLYLRLFTRIDGQPKTFSGARQYWDALQIGVYQRHGREHHVGDANWIMDNSNGVSFDGVRLIAKMPSTSIDLDLTFDRAHQVWTGWFHRRIFSQRVVLSRPRTKPGIPKSRLVGTWSAGDNLRKCLHIAQQQDGGFTAWYDTLSLPGLYRSAPGIVPLPWSTEHYGELASVSEVGRGVLRIGESPYVAGVAGPFPQALIVKLSEDGRRLVGRVEGQIAPVATHYRRVEGDSCRNAVS